MKLSNQELLNEIRKKSKQEQNLTLEVIELIREVNQRRLYLQLGFASLFDFVTKDLGYEPASAMRRIQAARMVSELPEVKNKIESGSLSLSVVSQVQSFFKKEETAKGEKLSKEQKLEILSLVENKSTREAEKELVKISPETVRKAESQREITQNLTELKLIIDNDLKQQLDELRLLLSHQNPNLSYVDLIRLMAEKVRKNLPGTSDEKLKKNLEAQRVKSSQGTQSIRKAQSTTYAAAKRTKTLLPAPEWGSAKLNQSRSRYISLAVRKYIWKRDNGCCQYKEPNSGRICQSRYQIQIDHIQRFSEGGGHQPENLRLLCRLHNNWRG